MRGHIQRNLITLLELKDRVYVYSSIRKVCKRVTE